MVSRASGGAVLAGLRRSERVCGGLPRSRRGRSEQLAPLFCDVRGQSVVTLAALLLELTCQCLALLFVPVACLAQSALRARLDGCFLESLDAIDVPLQREDWRRGELECLVDALDHGEDGVELLLWMATMMVARAVA